MTKSVVAAYIDWSRQVAHAWFESPKKRAFIFVCFVVITVLLNGIGLVYSQQLTDALFGSNIDLGSNEFELQNPMLIWFSYVLNINTEMKFLLFGVAQTVVFFVAVFFAFFRKTEDDLAAFWLLPMVGTFTLYINLSWFGSEVHASFAMYLFAFAFRHSVVAVSIMACLATLAHPTIGPLAFALHGYLAFLEGGPHRWRFGLAALLGVVAGYIASEMTYVAMGIEIESGRIGYALEHAITVVKAIVRNPMLSVVSVYWIFTIPILWRSLSKGQWPFALAALFPFAVSFGTDYTRVALTVGIPVALFTALWLHKHHREQTKEFVVRFAPALAPLCFLTFQVVEHGIISSGWPSIAYRVLFPQLSAAD